MGLKVNGKAYDWGDVNLQLPGLVIEPQEISYDDELEKEVVYGLGSKPRGYGRGNYKASGKLTLLRDDYDALLDYCKQQNTAFLHWNFQRSSCPTLMKGIGHGRMSLTGYQSQSAATRQPRVISL